VVSTLPFGGVDNDLIAEVVIRHSFNNEAVAYDLIYKVRDLIDIGNDFVHVITLLSAGS
jgi:hypothetical protein